MHHSEIRKHNETTTFYVKTPSQPITNVHVYKVTSPGFVFSEIVGSYPIVTMSNDYSRSTLTTPDENCYLCIQFGPYPIFVRVGNPDPLFLFYYVQEGQTISCRQVLGTDGSIHSSGTMVELGKGFYYYIPTTNDPSFFEIWDTALSKWMPWYMKIPYTTSIGMGKGTIELEPDQWQLLAIPIKYGYWDNTESKLVHDSVTRATIHNYVNAQLEDKYGVDGETLYDTANAYIGDNNTFLNYVPNLTLESSVHNFPLVYEDDQGGTIYDEVTPWLIKSKHSTSLEIEWGE